MYCDIVEPQVVGDTSAQLLKSIPAEGKFGDVIAKTFTNIQYVLVQTKSFEDVEVLLRNNTGDPVPFEREKVIITLQAKKFCKNDSEQSVNYYLNQQQGHAMFMFRGSPWQIGHGQVGFGLGGLFLSVARAVMPIIKRGANALGNIALNSGANFVGDVLAGKNAKEAAKGRRLTWRKRKLYNE